MKVALAVGGGTGPELAEVFERTLSALGGAELLRSTRLYATYSTAELAREDAEHYERFLLEARAQGCAAVFRTAFNAQSLYLVRERLTAVKVEALGDLLLVRDQAQGFYAGDNDAGSAESILRTCRFSKAVTWKILDFAVAEAQRLWGGMDRIMMVYKFHLLDTRFARWVKEYPRPIELVQPDTMNRALLRGAVRGRTLVVGSNEWLDVMHADLLARRGLVQDERFSVNHYLHERLTGLVEYQTVHGSADDLAGKGVVNPLATMRAAAAILGGEASSRLEAGIASAKAAGLLTPDLGGGARTAEVERAVLDSCCAKP